MTHDRASARRLLTLVVAMIIATLAAGLPQATAWRPILMLLVPAVAAWVVRRVSLLVALYLVQTAGYYGLPWLILHHHQSPQLVALVILWTAGVAVGCLLKREAARSASPAISAPPALPHLALAVALLAIYSYLVLTGQLGYQAQLTTGDSTPTGGLGTLATAAPMIALLLLTCALSSGRYVVGAGFLAAGNAIVLSLSGFRGAGIIFVISVVYVAALKLPRDSVWRRKRRVFTVGALLLMFLVLTFIVAAHVKNAAAIHNGASSQGTQLFGINEAPHAIATRLDASEPLQQGIDHRSDYNVRQAVSWVKQLEAGIPRLLWPGKPSVSYGQDVAATVYGIQYGHTSSFITVIGDTLVNFGIPGVIIGAVGFGYLLATMEIRIRSKTGVAAMALTVVLAYTVLTAQLTLILTAVAAIRLFLVTVVLWGLAETLARRRRSQPAPTPEVHRT